VVAVTAAKLLAITPSFFQERCDTRCLL